MEALTRTGSTIEHRCPTTVQHKHELEEKQLDIAEKHDERTWRSCCLTTDKHACVFSGFQVPCSLTSKVNVINQAPTST